MATAGDVIKYALQQILVQESEADLEPDEYADSIAQLNRMMAAWEAQGIDLGYTSVDNVSDVVSVADGALDGIISSLAIRVAPMFGRPIPGDLREWNREAMQAVRLLGQYLPPSEMPYTLPKGSGNYDGVLSDDNFYPDRQSDIEGG